MARRSALRRTARCAVAALLASGCAVLGVGSQKARVASLSEIRGSVDTEHESTGPLIVVLSRERNDEPGRFDIFDHFVLEGPGPFIFVVDAGTYRLAAFEDRNGDGNYDADEPLRRSSEAPQHRLGAGVHEGALRPQVHRRVGPVRVDLVATLGSEAQEVALRHLEAIHQEIPDPHRELAVDAVHVPVPVA